MGLLKKIIAASFFLLFTSTVFSQGPQYVNLGTYVTSLYNIDSDKGTFSADMWIWTTTPKAYKYNPNDSLEISYLSSQAPHVYIGLPPTLLGDKTVLSQKKIQGTFLHDFDLAKFPFDRQKLKIYLEDADVDITRLEFKPDPASGYDPSISIDGWKIFNLKSYATVKEYKTNFGNYTRSNDVNYSRIAIEIELKRDAPLIFFKITLGLFAAVLVAMFSTFMNSESDDLYSARLGLLGATLLAVVVNQQFADGKIGQTTTVTLIDSLHMLGFATVFLLFIGAIVSRYLFARKALGISHILFDRILFITSLIIFSIISFIMIGSAIRA
jgi:hypothetical protein